LKAIKVVHLVAGDLNGGAARGAYWLHKGLLKHGVESQIITNHHDDFSDPTVTSLSGSTLKRFFALFVSKLDSLVLLLFPKRKSVIFSTGFFGINYKSDKFYKNADIVHLHWINGLVSYKSIRSIKKPVIWSVRDMWPMTGGCHLSLDCEKYKSGCGNCPQLNGIFGTDFTRHAVKAKRKAFRRVQPVGISDWVTSQLNLSTIFGDNRAITIDNNVDFSVFFPINKEFSKKSLGLETKKKIILSGSTNSRDIYKGFSFFLESLKNLDKDDYFICVFGKPDIAAMEATGFEYKALGFLHDDVSMRLAYNAADVFVAPSIQEPFGKTLVEALACKVPVVCFDATGPAGIVEHKVNGYKAKAFEPEDMALGTDWVVKQSDYATLSNGARDSAMKKFDSVVIAEKYLKIYSDLLCKDLK
jgi:glycosyltransferase involved in cell wall biosynthesis